MALNLAALSISSSPGQLSNGALNSSVQRLCCQFLVAVRNSTEHPVNLAKTKGLLAVALDIPKKGAKLSLIHI